MKTGLGLWWTVLEPEAKGKISYMDPVIPSLLKLDSLLLIDALFILFVAFIHLLHYNGVDCSDWIFGASLNFSCYALEPQEGAELGWGPKDGEEGSDQKGFGRQVPLDFGTERDGVAREKSQGWC